MKKAFLFILLAISTIIAMAQVNPKPGYIITNEGDTVRGNIDFRTNDKLSKQCMFQANGADEYKTYKPDEIEGFRFDNGKYFVSRRLNVTGNPELYFAEFIVQGKMNLYCIELYPNEYYFLEREDGEMAKLTKRSIYNSSSDEILQEKKQQYGKVTNLLKDSWKAVQEVDEEDMSRKKLEQIVRDYHNDVCKDGSSCIVYEYKDESDKIKCHFKAFAGYAFFIDKKYFDNNSYPGSKYEIGLGLDIDYERLIKGFSVEANVAFTPDFTFYQKNLFLISVGAVKRFGRGKVQPLVRAGAYGVFTIGIYLGAGVQVGLGKHYARLHGDFYKSGLGSAHDMTKWGVTAEFAL